MDKSRKHILLSCYAVDTKQAVRVATQYAPSLSSP